MDHGTAAASTLHQVNNNRLRDLASNIKASLFIIFLMTHSPLPIYAQSSFSPFSFLGSLFNPASSPNTNWHRPRKVHPRKPQPPQQQIFFRPNLLTSQKFSSSQVTLSSVNSDVTHLLEKFSKKVLLKLKLSRQKADNINQFRMVLSDSFANA